jgi:hypothetical protein
VEGGEGAGTRDAGRRRGAGAGPIVYAVCVVCGLGELLSGEIGGENAERVVRVLVGLLMQERQRLVLAVAHSTRVQRPNQETKREGIGGGAWTGNYNMSIVDTGCGLDWRRVVLRVVLGIPLIWETRACFLLAVIRSGRVIATASPAA